MAVWADTPSPEEAPALDFSRYQVILDRKPFGDLPAKQEETAEAVPAAESFAKNLRVCSIIEQDDGSVRVGFVDMQSNKSYMLSVGDPPIDGIELVSASYEDKEAYLRRGSEMAQIKLQSGEVKDVSPAQQQTVMANAGDASQRRLSYAERRRLRQQRMQEQQAQPPPEPKYSGEELEKHLQDYQMDVIRQGLPPLPIPLTPEQDDQLVKEGILPPAE